MSGIGVPGVKAEAVPVAVADGSVSCSCPANDAIALVPNAAARTKLIDGVNPDVLEDETAEDAVAAGKAN